LQEEISWAGNREQEGRELEVLVATGEGRKDRETARLSGRAPDNRLVHFAVPEDLPEVGRPRPGDMVTVGVTYGAPHHLVADSALSGGTFSVRRTKGGDAWAALQDKGVEGAVAKPGVSLGMPRIGAPEPVEANGPACSA
ncbi:MAG TPA: tRNA (N6-isopentenyl adenosine(37)-C2)-methylthiotransferase MiaB, partial [Janibacter terrae]|nr:tRNA (N6-isopentenyl adenosine(37)-C2)-methylthiotransferase MiaB [Janibacter terrae]